MAGDVYVPARGGKRERTDEKVLLGYRPLKTA
jgi:hypothetical protein